MSYTPFFRDILEIIAEPKGVSDTKRFLEEVALTLGACQLVELELKLYIERALVVIEKQIKGLVPFKMKGEDYDDTPLGGLINIFKKLSNNPELVIELNKFKADRDFVAHKVIVECMDPDHEIHSDITFEIRRRLKDISREASFLRDAVGEESSRFIGHYYFDFISDDKAAIR